MAETPAPDILVAVAGTGTDVGKTWVTAAVASALRARGVRVCARKPAQSFAESDPPGARDAAVLAAATGERADDVCPAHRSYEVPMAPPMAAAALGRPAIQLAALLDELRWPAGAAVGFVETAGGVRSPIADDGDNAALIGALEPDLTVLVADAGLGTINSVRLSAAVLPRPLLVVLNRFDASDPLHRANREWLAGRDQLQVLTSPDALAAEIVNRRPVVRSGTLGRSAAVADDPVPTGSSGPEERPVRGRHGQVEAVGRRTSDAHGEIDDAGGSSDRRLDNGSDPLGDRGRRGMRRVLEHDADLVGADTRHDVVLPKVRVDPPVDDANHLTGRGAAVADVDLVDVIDGDEQDSGHKSAVVAGPDAAIRLATDLTS